MVLNQEPAVCSEPWLCSSQHTSTAPSARLQHHHHLLFSIKSFSIHLSYQVIAPKRFISPLPPGLFY